MIRDTVAFLRHNGIKALLAAEQAVKKAGGGKITGNLFDCECKYVGSDVRIIRETEDSTFIAKMNPDGTVNGGGFKILVTTDLHLLGDAEKRNKTLRLLCRQIADVKPDLVIFTGDVVLTDCQQIDAIQFGSLMEKMGVYWAYIFGNHEARAEKEFHKYFLMKNFASFPHCLSKIGDERLFGYGNFFINIMGAENKLLQSLCFLDSGRDICDYYRAEYNIPEDMRGYDFIKRNQMYFYENNIKSLREKYGDFKSMLFIHIPLPEYREVMELDGSGGRPTGKAKVLYGHLYEAVGCSEYNSGMFDKILELGSTQAVFAGHDHVNDFCAEYKGVHLVYAQCGGYDQYTMGDNFGTPEKDWPQGATIVDIGPDGTAEYKQRLNSIYLGSDD